DSERIVMEWRSRRIEVGLIVCVKEVAFVEGPIKWIAEIAALRCEEGEGESEMVKLDMTLARVSFISTVALVFPCM
ncbi:hypothetical protein Tco_0699003, partial [Tanacetum coccineum]